MNRNTRAVIVVVWMLFVSLLWTAATARAQADPVDPKTAARPKQPNRSFPLFGVSFLPPAGWREEMRNSDTLIGWWISASIQDAARAGPRAEVRLESGKGSNASLADAARGLAKQWDGKVSGDTTLGGDPALRVAAPLPEKGDGMRPVEAVVCEHGKRLILLMGGVTPGGEVHAALEALRESWKWIGVEPPSTQLSFARAPYRLFGRVLIDLPAMISLADVDDASTQANFELPNPGRGGTQWLFFAQLVPRNAGQTFDALTETFLDGVKKTMKPDPAPQWEAVKGGASTRFISNRFAGQLPSKADEKPQRMDLQWALVELDAKYIVMINFTYATSDADALSRYEAAARKIVASVRLAPPPPKKGSPEMMSPAE